MTSHRTFTHAYEKLRQTGNSPMGHYQVPAAILFPASIIDHPTLPAGRRRRGMGLRELSVGPEYRCYGPTSTDDCSTLTARSASASAASAAARTSPPWQMRMRRWHALVQATYRSVCVNNAPNPLRP